MKNKYMKKAMAMILAAVLGCSVVACGASETKNEEGESQNQVQEEVEKENQVQEEAEKEDQVQEEQADETEETAIVLTDQAGREVTLEKPAESIVSCYYITTYAAMALGIDDKVTGLEKKADSRPIYHMAAPELLEKTQVGSMKEFNVEATAALQPDLVLMPMKLLEYADVLTDMGIQVLVVKPESQELLEEMLLLIGKACGVEEKAEELIQYYQEKLDQINTITENSQAASVYMAGNSSYLTTAPKDMYQTDMIELAGGENVAVSLEGDYWTEISYEQLLAFNPEVIILPCNAEYTREELLADGNLAEVTAVKENRVYMMPQDIEEWDSPVPSGILGVLWMTSILNEETYSFETFKEDVSEYYNRFYGFEMDQTLITK